MENKTRDKNIELLRIFAMFLVILTHALLHSGSLLKLNILGGNIIIIDAIRIFAWMCNALFILISGYYMVDSKFKCKKILSLWGITIFYSIGIYIIKGIALGDYDNTIRCLFPIIKEHYWFATSYIILYLFAPAINLTISKLTQKQLKYIFAIIAVIVSILHPFLGFSMARPVIMIFIYCIGAYIKKYIPIEKENKHYLLKCILVLAIPFILSIILKRIYLYIESPIIKEQMALFYRGIFNYCNIFEIIAAVFLFMKIRMVKVNGNIVGKIITFITPSLFPIYLIHEHINIGMLLWNGIFDFTKYLNSYSLAFRIIGAAIIVFLVCLAIDLIRRLIYIGLKKFPIVNKMVEKLNRKLALIDLKVEEIFIEKSEEKEIQNTM